jgi:murein DD-endopeptidase MepM/ murein hydrolase activator NlpD
MVDRWTSRCRLCPTRAPAGKRAGRCALVVATLLACAASPAVAQTLSVSVRSRAVQPGEVMVVTVTAPRDVDSVSVRALGTQWPSYRIDETTWRALVGIDLEQRPGSSTLSVEASRASTTITSAPRTLTVLPRRFRTRTLAVAPDYVNPPPELLTRITSEAEFMRTVYQQSGAEPGWRGGFTRPVPGRANSSFGTRSVFNGQPRSPHAGTDFLSGIGTPILAPADGRVVGARDLFFTGNTVVIDHGLGVFSMLAHMSRVDVREGQVVAEGEEVGLVGATGRVTGPHLHWAMRVGTARVDPLSALALLGRTPPTRDP